MKKKQVAISMGEPSGISSEIILKCWLDRKKFSCDPFFVVDDIIKLESINRIFKLGAKIATINCPEETKDVFNHSLPVLDIKKKIEFELGKPSPKNSSSVLFSIEKCVDLILNKKASSMVTLPVCKASLIKAGFNYNGQTEFISHLIEKKVKRKFEEIMIMTTTQPLDKGKNLIVGLFTTHIPLSDFSQNLSINKIKKKIRVFENSLKKIWRIDNPKIGVCSINPHAGEKGLLGKEEVKIIQPAIIALKKMNYSVEGPLSSDSCFFKDVRKNYDGIFCLYHDQGLIPVKMLDFFNSVNVTGGLPITRVSPDHGPAFDISKKNIANTDSLKSSLKFLQQHCNDDF